MSDVTEEERATLEGRQLRHKASNMIGVPAASKCFHGFPQAALWRPVGDNDAIKPVSGITRLTCPHLVKAVDELEASGAIPEFNGRLAVDEEWQAALAQTTKDHSEMRAALMTDKDRARLDERFGSPAHVAAFMASGLAGMSPSKVDDVKCLHAQLGDWLLRGTSPIGAEVAAQLEGRGVSLGGCEGCHEQCNVRSQETAATWFYQSPKNRSGLRQRAARRSAEKAHIKAKEGADEGSPAAAE